MNVVTPLQGQNQPTSSTAAELCARLRDLAPTVAAQRADFDKDGQLPDALFATLADFGMFRLWLPADLGGHELSAFDFMDVVEEASALDGAIGWLVGNGGGMGRVGAFLDEACAREIFDDPYAFVVSGTAGVGRAVPVEGGYRVSGRWPFGSGSPHATWFTPFCEITEGGEGTGRIVNPVVPRADVILHDNWKVSGLCGTGSGDFELQDVFVPHRFVHPQQPEPTQPGTLYRLPTGSIYPWTVATVPTGLARGALREFLAIAGKRKRRNDTLPLAERELVQYEVGRIEARLSASRAYMRQAMSDLLDALEESADLVPARVRLRMACTFASEGALSAIGQLTEIAGAISIFRTCPLERYERDARAAAKHIAMSPTAYVTGGKLVMGQDLSGMRF
jgi:alkylation response protein AidB-like acyl-CoA dehydrogenase